MNDLGASGPMCSRLLASAMLISLSAGFAAAQETAAQPAPTESVARVPAPVPSADLGSAVSVQINFDYTTAYFYRGIVQEDSGLVLQPVARLSFNFYESSELKLDGFVGAWSSFHGQKTGADTRGDFTEYWYEADLFAGVTAAVGKLAFTTSYTFLTSPNDAFETVQELGFTIALDDSEWLKKWSLKPYATIAIETGADASDGADSDTGVYLELGVSQGLSFDIATTPVTLTFPATVGLSLSNYYQDASGDDDTFGFAQVGARASFSLGEPGRFGAWTLNAGVSLLFLGDNTRGYKADDGTEVIGTVGLQWNF